jgi:hypothetical protein
MSILESLKEIIEKGFSKTDIEYLAKIPKNSLSSILSEKRKLSKKSELKIKRFLDSDIPDPLSFKRNDNNYDKINLIQEKKEVIIQQSKPIIKSTSEQLEEKIKKEEEKKRLEKIINSAPSKKYFNGKDLPDYDPEIGHEGISNPRLPY